ncbi:DUF2933 domain-containing protein [Billgrantia desiderata]|uniref:DUF2933 domain-containing protein n=1 Tax=Billgrantia desiderata TaxID=52021 RepID=UPI001F2CE26C|nr:DUF2933 domain-containing protein [Halomonas desiderata]
MNRSRSNSELHKPPAEVGHETPAQTPGKHSGGLHQWMMPLCLVLMGGAFVFVLWRGQTGGSLLLLLPMLLCLGMHFLMHRHGHGHRHGDE